MHVYLANDGKYRQGWSHKILIPTAEDLLLFALLDAACNDGQDVRIPTPDWAVHRLKGGTKDFMMVRRMVVGEGRVDYWIPGSGKYEGERDC